MIKTFLLSHVYHASTTLESNYVRYKTYQLKTYIKSIVLEIATDVDGHSDDIQLKYSIGHHPGKNRVFTLHKASLKVTIILIKKTGKISLLHDSLTKYLDICYISLRLGDT